jgi:hypothetical protein
MFRSHTLLAAILVLAGAGIARAEFPDWNRFTDVKTIDVLTVDPDGDPRETPVWFVLLNGEAYLRTNDSRWLANLRRDPNLRLKIEGKIYEAQTEEIPGQAIVEKVDIACERKYGLEERLLHIFRMRQPEILRILPR